MTGDGRVPSAGARAAGPGGDAATDHVVLDEGGTLAVRVDGPSDGPPLLLLNSLGADWTMWDPQLPAWAATRRVIRVDQRGHGRSVEAPPPLTLDRLGADCVTVLDHLDVDRADVCGVSLGGLVAQWLLVHAPDRVGGAVLAATAARIGTGEAWRTRAATVTADGVGRIADAVMERFFSERFRAAEPETVARAREVLLATTADGYAGCCCALAAADLRGDLEVVRAPCLVVAGSADVATTPADAADLADRLADAELAELPGAGHLLNLEQPQRFTDLVAAFLHRRGLAAGVAD